MPFPTGRMISPRISTMTELPAPVSKLCVSVHSSLDIFTVRQKGRALALQLDFSPSEATLFAAIISELGRDILVHAHFGEVTLEPLQLGHRVGIRLVAAYGDGSTVRAPNTHVGHEAPLGWFARFGVSHLLEEIGFDSQPGSGVTLTGIKWRR